MKAKVFEVILHKLPSGKSPASELEAQLNGFLAQSPDTPLPAAVQTDLFTAPAGAGARTTACAGGCGHVARGESV